MLLSADRKCLAVNGRD